MSIRVWPVIHLDSISQAVENAHIAQRCGVHGVFLIHMEGDDDMIEPAFHAIQKVCPNLAIGANFLSLSADQALERSLEAGLDATWSDNCGVRSDKVSDMAYSLAKRLQENSSHTFFGSVAFKYQQVDLNPPLAAQHALKLGFTPTTSGLATGSAPDIDKLLKIREAIGPNASLALASGVTPDNVHQFTPFITDILVSTGVSCDFHHFDEKLLEKLMAQV